MVKYKGQLTDKEFLQKIKKREKELLLAQAHREKHIKVGITFSELYHIQAYLEGNDKEYNREELEKYWQRKETLKSIRLESTEEKDEDNLATILVILAVIGGIIIIIAFL